MHGGAIPYPAGFNWQPPAGWGSKSCPGVHPLGEGYVIFVYWIFGGKLREGEGYH
jgi:hypothetical protein